MDIDIPVRFFGNKASFRSIDQHFLRSNSKILMLVGRSGLGKTSYIRHFAQKTGATLCEYGSIDTRGANAILTIIAASRYSFNRKIILIEEGDSMDKKTQLKLLQKAKDIGCPLVICCNYPENMDYKLMKYCNVVRLCTPTYAEKIEYLKYIMQFSPCDENVDIDEIAKSSDSFRGLYNNLLGDASKRDENTDYFEQIGSILRGEDVNITMSTDDLFLWLNDNASLESRTNISLADLFVRKSGGAKYTDFFLRQCRSNKPVRFPYTVYHLAEIKRERQPKEKPKVEVKKSKKQKAKPVKEEKPPEPKQKQNVWF